MKSKEDYLLELSNPFGDGYNFGWENVEPAMDAFAEEMVLSFSEWKDTNWRPCMDGFFTHIFGDLIHPGMHSTKSLYQIYLKILTNTEHKK